MRKKIYLLDAYALIFRGYYAFIKNPRLTSGGLNTSAILGFLNSLFDIMKRNKGELIGVAFDKGGSKARYEIYQEYKSNRSETPEAIMVAVPYIHKILAALDVHTVEMAGFEADDIIGTLAKKAEGEGFDVYMVTPDKDYGQLVSEHIFMYKPPKKGGDYEVWGEKEVCENFGLERAEQVVDYLGLMGDSVDNIPGIAGVGGVTASKLLKEFGSMENLFENVDKLSGKLKEKIENGKDMGLLSKQLAKIILDVPVEFDAKNFEIGNPNMEEVLGIFEELEFKTLLNSVYKIYGVPEGKGKEVKNGAGGESAIQERMFVGENAAQGSLFGGEVEGKFKTIADVEHSYEIAEGDEEILRVVEEVLKQKEVCFDTETTSLDDMEAELVGISLCWEAHKGVYIPFGVDFEDSKRRLGLLKSFFESEDILKIGQNLKYDIKVLMNYGIAVRGKKFDTMVAHYLINADQKHGMDYLSEVYLKYKPVEIEELIGKKGKGQKNMREVEVERMKEYAVEDADVTFQLKGVLEKEILENGYKELFEEVEMPLMEVLAAMEREGIRVDVEFLKELSASMDKDIEKEISEIYERAGEEFNISSPKQLGEILFDKLKISNKVQKTKTGQYATGESVLSELAGSHPIIDNILEYRQLQKLKSTYVDALPQAQNKKTGRVHTTFMQTVAATGRLSSNNPNLQNIPIRSERGQQIRKAFVPRDEDFTLVSADYSQIELRIIASLSGEKNMIEAFMNGYDIHRATAAKVFGVDFDKVTKEQRSHAKTVNFGIIYGVSAFGLSEQTTLTRSESKEMIDSYYQSYPMLKDYINKQVRFAREKGYVDTILGRRRYLPDINSRNSLVRSGAERNAVNSPIQGSAADIIKIAMVRIQEKMRGYKSKMLLQVHDELIFDVEKSEFEEVSALIKREMEGAYKMEVPLVAEVGEGKNWFEAH